MSDAVLANQAPQIPSLKVPPHSVDAEQSVLGSLMLNSDAWLEVVGIVEASDFYRLEHRTLFEAMMALWQNNQPIDAVTLAEAMTAGGQLDRIGGAAFLAGLAENTPSTRNAAAYSRIVQEHSTRRRLIRTGQHIAESAFEPDGKSGNELLDQAEREVFGIAERRWENEGPKPITPMLKEAADVLDMLHKNKGKLPGLSCGFSDLDSKTGGFKNSDFIVVAGRPSMGKTALALNMVEHAVVGCNTPSLMFSLEMSAEQLVMRLLSSLARIDQSKMQRGDLEDHDWTKFSAAVSQLTDSPLYIDDSPSLTSADLRGRVRRVSREVGGIGLIVIDYLQLMRTSGKYENRTTEISEISRSLKALAKEMHCPVIGLSQLNREVEKRADKRPLLADLRDSGAIEQDADIILFIYRDEVYNDDSPDKGIAEINIGKQRNGATGKVKLSFLSHLTKFEDLASDRYDDYPPA